MNQVNRLPTQAPEMTIEWDVPIEMDDGVVLRADIFRPTTPGAYPVLLSYGPYGKGISFQEKYKPFWDKLVGEHPEILETSTNRYQSWELVDPERWVPDGYAIVRLDSRGAGRSQGVSDPWSPRENRDLHDCIEWAGTRDWSNGRVGLIGISYYAMNAWCVASLQPPHLAAICCWEGSSDFYRELSHHGGIVSGFCDYWYRKNVLATQHGLGEKGFKTGVTGDWASGPETMSSEELAAHRVDFPQWILDRPLDGPDYRERSPQFDKIHVPLLSAANWGGQGLHTRGNFEGWLAAQSGQKWLEAHGGTHWTDFYNDRGLALQKRFFECFLHDRPAAWQSQPRVSLQVRHVDRFVERAENEWPLARTKWTPYHLQPANASLGTARPAAGTTLSFKATGEGLFFVTPAFEAPMEFTGPIAARLAISSTTRDADILLGLHLFDPKGDEVVFQGSNDPRVSIGLGWLRASHRKLDAARSKPYRPFHSHDEALPLTPGEPVQLDIEIWPTCIVVPAGYRIGLTVRGKDCTPDDPPTPVGGMSFRRHSSPGPFTHANPADRPAGIFDGKTTIHFGPRWENQVLLPVIPAD